jgi:hypothetical protein
VAVELPTLVERARAAAAESHRATAAARRAVAQSRRLVKDAERSRARVIVAHARRSRFGLVSLFGDPRSAGDLVLEVLASTEVLARLQAEGSQEPELTRVARNVHRQILSRFAAAGVSGAS